jgi:hypothetical protein
MEMELNWHEIPKKRKKDKSNLFNNKDKKTSNVNKIAQN